MQRDAGMRGHQLGPLALASCTRFSPKTRCPAAITGVIASASKVFDTATSVTQDRSRRASRQARTISASTKASPLGEGAVSGAGFQWSSNSSRPAISADHSNFIYFKKVFLNRWLYGSHRGQRTVNVTD